MATGEAAHAAEGRGEVLLDGLVFSHGGDTGSYEDGLENTWLVVTTKIAMRMTRAVFVKFVSCGGQGKMEGWKIRKRELYPLWNL